MSKGTARLAAIALGVALGGGAFGLAHWASRREEPWPSFWHPDCELVLEDPPTSCPPFPSELRVNFEEGLERLVPLAWEDVGAEGKAAAAEYRDPGDHYGESRTLILLPGAGSNGRRMVAAYRADDGECLGFVDEEHSSLHRHEGVVCFDLTVHPGTGSGTTERWRGQIHVR